MPDAVVQFLEQFTQARHLFFTNQRGVASLDVLPDLRAGLDQQAPLVREAHDLRAPVTGVRDALDVSEAFDFVDQLSHCLLGHPGAGSQLGQPGSIETEEGHDGLVRGLQLAMPSDGETVECSTLEVLCDVEQRLTDVVAAIVFDVFLSEIGLRHGE